MLPVIDARKTVVFNKDLLVFYDFYDVVIKVGVEFGNRLLLPWSKPFSIGGSGTFPLFKYTVEFVL
jgi:hypothetical protein